MPVGPRRLKNIVGASHPENKDYIAGVLRRYRPTKVLDVGPGAGVYLDILRSIDPDIHVTGIEVWAPYIEQFRLRERYDLVLQGDVRELRHWGYDCVIFGDVLEHMPTEDAVECWNSAGGSLRILSLPIIHYEQEAINNNPYEVHVRPDWTTTEVLREFSGIDEYKEFDVTGAFVSYM